MTSTLRDSLLIGSALITILACGFGIGRMTTPAIEPAPIVPIDSISQETLDALRRSIDLTPAQEEAITPELQSLKAQILDSRHQALVQYYESLLQFHDKISPKLNPRQQEILKANRKLLEEEKANRFSIQP